MARPRDPVSDYRVAIHKIREYRYAATQPLYHNEAGTLARKYIHWGQVDERLVFNQNELWKTPTQDERAKFFFLKAGASILVLKTMQSRITEFLSQKRSLMA